MSSIMWFEDCISWFLCLFTCCFLYVSIYLLNFSSWSIDLFILYVFMVYNLVQLHLILQPEMAMKVLTHLKLFLTQSRLCWLRHLLRISWPGIHYGPSPTNFMVTGMNCFLYVAVMMEGSLLHHARYSLIIAIQIAKFIYQLMQVHIWWWSYI